ncbi:MAG: hypothetical protein HFH68_09910 [Lachnospiraceae bacterium]|nr:hypothetical protein [Lachnospiraceae bacterium]
MIIQRISGNRAANHLYVFNNNNYSQVNGVPVNPVKPVRKLPGLERGEDERRPAVIYGQDNGAAPARAQGTKQIDAIKNEYMSSGKAEYDTSNIYERERMAAEGTVLLGMNFDTFA